MSSNNTEQDLKARLEELEAEVNQKQAANEKKVETVHAEIETDTEEEAELIAKVYSWLSLARNKFNSLSSGGKLVVGVAGIWLGFTALNMVLHLVTNLIVLGILGLVLYFVYQKLVVES
ncbi:conserved hypothetical protein [Hyella patelloides LEGE 07179]|uniref:Uncharacterized protein n=1 Tax=Hyella patelloides LEGE 07179 TaxID=945734 RepID=A0A563W0W8_9CYAN|nr:hypothetical protein [Hyella patelloides]VEP17267.1 conserved hypothetical protein [Hyella patelloides LEGE 07179]